ncbi:MAG TPA: hypothetical protein VEX62_08955 [Candidatus Limnocylindrales bacterium]|nr:hypothetical protein [Candidatus Limnocylindrales bacterium]
MKRRLLLSAASAALLAMSMVSGTFAAQPANPGCFGQDRAAWLHANGGAAWGAIAPTRAGDNGAINRAYAEGCGGVPSN